MSLICHAALENLCFWINIREIRHLWYYYFYKSTSWLKSMNRNSLNGFFFLYYCFQQISVKDFIVKWNSAPYVKFNKNVIYESGK